MGLIWFEIESYSDLFKSQKWFESKQLPSSARIISPSTPNQKFEIAILFSVIGGSGNYVFEDDNHPTGLRVSVVSYAPGEYKVL